MICLIHPSMTARPKEAKGGKGLMELCALGAYSNMIPVQLGAGVTWTQTELVPGSGLLISISLPGRCPPKSGDAGSTASR
jgi:hypothetical protein